jgi:putative flippase GtrA
MIARAASLVWRATYTRYVAASAIALASDLALFMLLLNAGMAPIPVSAIGYSAGLLVHWLISSRYVFSRGDNCPFVSKRRRQKLLFVASAMVGLAITSAIVGIGSHLGLDARLAKLCAIALSFQTTYLLRRTVVFA